jgi:hypothetical protein
MELRDRGYVPAAGCVPGPVPRKSETAASICSSEIFQIRWPAKVSTGMFFFDDGFSRAQQQSAAVCIDFRRTIRPDRPDQTEPLLDLFPEGGYPLDSGSPKM